MSSIDYSYFFALAEKHGVAITDYRGKHKKRTTRNWKRREHEDIHGVVFHQTGGGDSVRGLAKYHMGPNHISRDGLPGIAYTLFVNKAGQVYLCNDIEDVTWSQGDRSQPGDENKMFLSVCFGGKFYPWPGTKKETLEAQPTPEQMAVARKLWAFLMEGFKLTELDLYGHYDFGKEACPGDRLADFIEDVNDEFDWRAIESDGRPFDLTLVEDQQAALELVGYDPGKVDGLWGKKTRQAMQEYQRDHRLPRTSRWHKLVSAELYRELKEASA
jgi:hypothetical protein